MTSATTSPGRRFSLPAALLLFCALALRPADLFAGDEKVWLTAGQDAAREMVVSWASAVEIRTALLHYGPTRRPGVAPVRYPLVANAAIKECFGGKLGCVYHAPLKKLKPDTEYAYRIVAEGRALAEATFRTAPTDACEPFSFAVFGDSHSLDGGAAKRYDELLLDVQAHGARVAFNMGDMVNRGDKADEWADFLAQSTVAGRRLPIMPVMGNHDHGPGKGNAQHMSRIFRTPANNEPNLRSHYSVRYGGALFAVLSNHDGDPAEQAAWLDKELTQTDAVWKFVFIHEPFLTCALFGHEPDEEKVGRYFLPLFRKHRVDMVFSGHNHMYELFQPYDGEKFVSDPAKGTIHVTSGGAAKGERIMLLPPSFSCEGRVQSAMRYHFLMITVEGDSLSLEFWDEGGLSGGGLTGPEEHLRLVKPGTPVCHPETVPQTPSP
ncbi:MAG: metallophosphoesterase family protein [Myxococcales bacterium]|nr:MAG: metallophosphoesterase family protein [Myxococcales bacterium]